MCVHIYSIIRLSRTRVTLNHAGYLCDRHRHDRVFGDNVLDAAVLQGRAFEQVAHVTCTCHGTHSPAQLAVCVSSAIDVAAVWHRRTIDVLCMLCWTVCLTNNGHHIIWPLVQHYLLTPHRYTTDMALLQNKLKMQYAAVMFGVLFGFLVGGVVYEAYYIDGVAIFGIIVLSIEAQMLTSYTKYLLSRHKRSLRAVTAHTAHNPSR